MFVSFGSKRFSYLLDPHNDGKTVWRAWGAIAPQKLLEVSFCGKFTNSAVESLRHHVVRRIPHLPFPSPQPAAFQLHPPQNHNTTLLHLHRQDDEDYLCPPCSLRVGLGLRSLSIRFVNNPSLSAGVGAGDQIGVLLSRRGRRLRRGLCLGLVTVAALSAGGAHTSSLVDVIATGSFVIVSSFLYPLIDIEFTH